MALTMHYRVEFYEGPLQDERVVFSYEPAGLPVSYAIGQFVDPSGWTGNSLPPDQHYQITAVEHQLTIPDGREGQHNLAISLRAVPRE